MKYFTGVVQGVFGKKRFLVRFQNGCEKYITLNQITNVALERISVTREAEMPIISVIYDNTIDLEKGYYHGFYFLINFDREYFL